MLFASLPVLTHDGIAALGGDTAGTLARMNECSSSKLYLWSLHSLPPHTHNKKKKRPNILDKAVKMSFYSILTLKYMLF